MQTIKMLRCLKKTGLIIALILSFLMMITKLNAAQISVNFKNVEITALIETVAKLSEKTFLIDPRVRGRVTLISNSLVDETELFNILLSVLSLYGYAVVPTKNSYQVVPTNIANTIPAVDHDLEYGMVTEIIEINNVPANSLTQVLQSFISPQSRIVSIPNSNKIIISDSKINIDRLKKIIKKVDTVSASDYEIIQLKYASVNDIVPIIKSIYQAQGAILKIEIDNRANRLIIVSNSVSTRLAIRTLVADLDKPLGQDEGNLKVIYLKYADSTKLAPLLTELINNESFKNIVNSSSSGEGNAAAAAAAAAASSQSNFVAGGKVDFSIKADETLNALIVLGPSAVTKVVRDLVNQLDIPRAQIAVEMIIAEVSENVSNEIGVNFASAGTNGILATNFNDLTSGYISSLTSSGGDSASILGASIANTPSGGVRYYFGQIGKSSGTIGIVNAINSDTYSNVLAKPFIITLDNEESELKIADEIPFKSKTETSSTGSVFNVIERKDVGIILKLTPQITAEDKIKMKIYQEFSTVSGANANDITTSKRTVNSNILVNNNQMIAIGGLTQVQTNESYSKVPLLGDIPILKYLFSYKSATNRKTNLVIFIKPYILHGANETFEYTRKKYLNFRDKQHGIIKKIKISNDLLIDIEGFKEHEEQNN